MKKHTVLFFVLVLAVAAIPVLAITITDSGTLESSGWTGTPPNEVYDGDLGNLLSICGKPGDTASFEIHYTVQQSTCHLISAAVLIVGKGPQGVYNQPVLSEFTVYHQEVFPESGQIDFAAGLLCIIPLHDPDDYDAPVRYIEADYALTASAPGNGKCDADKKVTICHVPQGNPDAAHTISISRSALPAHLAHGDYLGVCEGD
ncbi:MAG: hypothetical protein H6672_08150 [Anaerolineaceae bacterium]|nr:hypothetical protein [Anaerolineaceae bacterium]